MMFREKKLRKKLLVCFVFVLIVAISLTLIEIKLFSVITCDCVSDSCVNSWMYNTCVDGGEFDSIDVIIQTCVSRSCFSLVDVWCKYWDWRFGYYYYITKPRTCTTPFCSDCKTYM